MELDLNVSVGKVLVGDSDGLHSLVQEVLFGFVNDHLGEGGSIESYSGSLADDDSGEEELVEDGGVDCCEGSAVGSSLGSVFLDPSGLDFAGGEDEDCLLELLLEFIDEFLIDGGEEELAASEVDLDEKEALVLLVGVLTNLCDGDSSD